MNIRILLGTFTILLINKLNGRFLLVNVGGPDVDDPDVDDEDRHRIGAPDVDDDNDPSRIEPNSILQNSRNCPIACPNCCDDNACGADEQKYCYECCPSPAKEQKQGLSCKPVNIRCMENNDCCTGLCQEDEPMPYGKCAEKNDGKLKKEGEACGQSCDDDCGNCEDGLTCGPSYSPSCRCGTCKR